MLTLMVKDNEQYAYLTVTGDFDPEQITSVLGLVPSESWSKGDRNERTHYERKFSRWSLESRLARSASLEDHVRDVLKQSLNYAEQIRQVGRAHTVFIQLVGWFHTDYPGFGLDSSTIAGLAELNVGIDCDFYYLYSHEREDSD
ncbi:DUF4279 domain-containing protein [Edaphobacter sp. HDX4]|uniref:DUF4279 domain-containing protein n=1 Tax=Edaphobacter sp. HDX4 TaxID=2794064 RepID=UPI002FE652E7